MTVLQALAGYYDRTAAEDDADAPPPFGFSRENVSYAVVLSPGGDPVDTISLLGTSGKKPRPRALPVPQAVKRTSGIAANFLWDKTAYALGAKRNPDTKRLAPAEREHAAFRALHEELLADSDDAGLRALHAFLNAWRPEKYSGLRHDAEDMLDTNVVFRLDGDAEFLHDRAAAKEIWSACLDRRSAGAERGFCLVSGRRAPVARLHPALKGVTGAQSSGASIVSFNLDAFESFGKKQGANAPVSDRAAFAYTTALNALLARGSKRRIQIGDTTTVFWAEASGEGEAAAAEELISWMIEPPPSDDQESTKVRDALADIAAGRPRQLADAAPGVREDTRFYVLGLAPNAARLSVRFWHEDTIGGLARRIGEHWKDLSLSPAPWRTPPSARRLLYETAVLRKAENIPPNLGGALMRAILTGGRYPRTLFSAIIARMRADGEIAGLRAAICKACLARDYRLGFEKEDVPVSLDRNETHLAYRLGRLFAVYEGVQRAALGSTNATIKDGYYGAASATPASVFPLLERRSVHHLSRIRKDKGGLAVKYEREVDAILGGVDTLPRSLRLEDQGRFALGYHHQREDFYSARNRGDAPDAGADEGIEP